MVITPPTAFTPHTSQISPFLYLNRCSGGCTIHGSSGANDARTQTSSIPSPGTYVVGEFQTFDQLTGAALRFLEVQRPSTAPAGEWSCSP